MSWWLETIDSDAFSSNEVSAGDRAYEKLDPMTSLVAREVHKSTPLIFLRLGPVQIFSRIKRSKYDIKDQLEESVTAPRSPLITSSVGSRFDPPALARDLTVFFLLFDGLLGMYSSSELPKSE